MANLYVIFPLLFFEHLYLAYHLTCMHQLLHIFSKHISSYIFIDYHYYTDQQQDVATRLPPRQYFLKPCSLSGGKCHTGLLLTSPIDHCSTDLEHVLRCYFAIIYVTSLDNIRVPNTLFRTVLVIAQAIVHGALQETHNVFYCSPMFFQWVGAKLGHIGDCVCDVWSGPH